MVPTRWRTFALIALTLAAAPASGETAPRPLPREARAAMDFFLGAWRCEGRTFDSPLEKGYPFATDLRVGYELDGAWLALHYDIRASDALPHPPRGLGLWGWDAQRRRIRRFFFDNAGNAETSAESSGWQGDALVFGGDTIYGGKRFSFRQRFTRLGRDRFRSAFDMQLDGKWVPGDGETCTREPATGPRRGEGSFPAP
jgi:hypothetical protein